MLTKLIKRNSFSMIKLTLRSFRGKGYDRDNFPDNRIRTGIEVSPYRPQFTLTEEEKKGNSIITQQTRNYQLKKEY